MASERFRLENGWFNAKMCLKFRKFGAKHRSYTCYGCLTIIPFPKVQYLRTLSYQERPEGMPHNYIVCCQECFKSGTLAPKSWNDLYDHMTSEQESIGHYEIILHQLLKQQSELVATIDRIRKENSELRNTLQTQEQLLGSLRETARSRSEQIVNLHTEIKTHRDPLLQTLSDMVDKLEQAACQIRPPGSECGICTEISSQLFVYVPCGHVLCGVCTHAQDTCPFCRATTRERVKLHSS